MYRNKSSKSLYLSIAASTEFVQDLPNILTSRKDKDSCLLAKIEKKEINE